MTPSKFVIPHAHSITKKERQNLNGHRSLIVWFTGLSGSGKSTLAGKVEEELYKSGYHTYILDGDNVRTGLNKDLGFDEGARKENIRRIGEVARLFVDAGVIVLASFIAPFKKEREAIKSLVKKNEFLEIYVNCPLNICEQRDVKGLYKKARAGEIKNFTGIDSPFEAPDKPNLEIRTDLLNLNESVEKVMKKLEIWVKGT